MRVILRAFEGCILAGFFVVLLVSAVPVCSAAYSVGVKVGDWVKYEVSGSGIGSEDFIDFSQMEWMKGEVLSVSGTSVTLQLTAHSGSSSADQVQKLIGDVATASGNLTFVIIPAGLKEGDAFPLEMFSPAQTTLVINDTVSRTYMGARRDVNVFDISYSGEGFAFGIGIYWDQATGVLLELSMNASTPEGNMQMNIKAVETNMWSAGGLLGGDIQGFFADNMIYIVVITAVAAVAVVVAIVFIARRPKPAAAVTETSAAA